MAMEKRAISMYRKLGSTEKDEENTRKKRAADGGRSTIGGRTRKIRKGGEQQGKESGCTKVRRTLKKHTKKDMKKETSTSGCRKV